VLHSKAKIAVAVLFTQARNYEYFSWLVVVVKVVSCKQEVCFFLENLAIRPAARTPYLLICWC
jgi:hypothetical protein